MNLKDRFFKTMRMDEAAPLEGGKPAGSGAPPPGPTIEDLQKTVAELMAMVKSGNKPAPTPTGDDDLAEQARKSREKKDSETKNQQSIEKAVMYNSRVKDWAQTNAALLPKTVQEIITQSDKETYDSQSEKASAIKLGIVQEFFTQQANLDLLTESQKIQLEDFKKLTKNEKHDRVQNIFDNIFEPTFESKVRIEKAAHLNKGLAGKNQATDEYEQRMIAQSREKFLKIKGD